MINRKDTQTDKVYYVSTNHWSGESLHEILKLLIKYLVTLLIGVCMDGHTDRLN